MDKYHVKEATDYGCTVFQVINSKTGIIAFYDKNEKVAADFCKRQNDAFKKYETNPRYRAIEKLIQAGINFEKNVYELSSRENSILEKAAKENNYYPKPNNSCISAIRHARYYLYLQRYYYKHKALFV